MNTNKQGQNTIKLRVKNVDVTVARTVAPLPNGQHYAVCVCSFERHGNRRTFLFGRRYGQTSEKAVEASLATLENKTAFNLARQAAVLSKESR